MRIDLGSDEGVLGSLTRGTDRYDDDTCEGEKPRTMLVVLLSEIPVAAEEADAAGDALSDVDSAEAGSLSVTAGAIIVGVTVGGSAAFRAGATGASLAASGARYE